MILFSTFSEKYVRLIFCTTRQSQVVQLVSSSKNIFLANTYAFISYTYHGYIHTSKYFLHFYITSTTLLQINYHETLHTNINEFLQNPYTSMYF